MKILFIAPHLSTGGAPQYLLKKIHELNSDHDIYCIEYENVTGGVLIVQRSQIETILGSRLITLGENKEQLLEYITNISPDVIHFEEMPEYFCNDNLAKKIYVSNRKYKIIETSHDSSFDPAKKLYFPDRFIFVSEFQRKLFSSLNLPSDVVEYPIVYKTKTDRTQALQSLGLDPNKTHFLNVGLFTSRKNQAEIIEYARKLENENVQFHFVGNQADNFKWYWEPLMKNFPSNCKWWGERKDVDTFYNAMDVFLFTSKGTEHDKETNPLVVREAIGWNIPILMYNLPVYCGMYDKYKNITWMSNIFEENIHIIKSKFIKNNMFNIQIEDFENKLNFTYLEGNVPLKNVLVSVKDRDSKVCIFAYNYDLLLPNSSFWIIPLPKTMYDFKNNEEFGGFLIQIFSDETMVYEHDIKYRNVNIEKPILEFSDNDPTFINYNEFFVQKIYDKYNIENFNTCIDIGANVGLFTKYLKLKNCKNVYCFEPNSKALVSLKRNVESEPGVKIFERGISSKNEKIKLYIDSSNSLVSSKYNPISNVTCEIECITLLDFISEYNISNIDIVKIDTEGMEFDLIDSYDSTIFDKVDNFLIEYHSYFFQDGESKLTALINKLEANKYLVSRDHKYNIIFASKTKKKMNTLENIRINHNINTDKNTTHAYFETYETLFSKFKDRPINLIEVGVYNGGSLKLWKEYFHRDSKIYGVDVNLSQINKDYIDARNTVLIEKNAYYIDNTFLSPIGFDIAIDDGSHWLQDQVKFFEAFKDRLNVGGVLIIEDIQPDGYDYFKNLTDNLHIGELIDLRHIKNRYDDILFVYKKD